MWYKTGKINVTLNSPVVIGVGTMWADAKNGVMPGMIMIAPDNKLYEVKQVGSNTSLTLNSNYTGATTSAQAYAIITTYEGDITQFSARFSALLTYFQGSRSELIDVLTSDGDVKLTKDDGSFITVPSYPKLVSSIDDRIISTLWDKTRYAMPSQGAGQGWYQIGTVITDQHGDTIVFNFNGGSSYNGYSVQTCIQNLVFRYGNRAVDTNVLGAASITLFTTGNRPMVGSAAMIESARNTFDIYIMLNAFVTRSTYMTVDARSPGQLAKVNVSFKRMDTAPTGTMDFVEYKTPTYDGAKSLPDYEDIAKPFINGFGGSSGRRISGAIVESQVSLLTNLQGRGSEIFRVGGGSKIGMPPDGASIHLMSGDVSAVIAVDYNNGNVSTMTCNKAGLAAGIVKSSALWGTSNTTVDANGFIKKASPIVKLFRDGTCELNNESQGVTTERVSEGVYRISGTLGFNADAEWGGPDGGIEVPLDRNKQPLIWVDYEVEPSGDLLIKTYHRTHPTAPEFARNVVLGYDEGMPIDIPDDRWVDLRVEMPEVEPVIDPDDVNADEQPTEPESETSDPGPGLMADNT
ncbi:TPA: hypothetical protein ACKP07_005013 [Serratia marcescens]|uniref:phage tail fiber protein n=1 Tax=Serratia marcescens TaxID=615 RepID=UPI00339C88EC